MRLAPSSTYTNQSSNVQTNWVVATDLYQTLLTALMRARQRYAVRPYKSTQLSRHYPYFLLTLCFITLSSTCLVYLAATEFQAPGCDSELQLANQLDPNFLYSLPAENHPVWERVRAQPSTRDARIRLLRANNTVGAVVVHLGTDGIDRLSRWATIPDLVFFNPCLYFANHPEITGVWIETCVQEGPLTGSYANSDPADIVTRPESTNEAGVANSVVSSSTNTGSVRPIEAAVVIRRSEYTRSVAIHLRYLQALALHSGAYGNRHLWSFPGQLHGR